MPSADRARLALALAAGALAACAIDLDDTPARTVDPDVTKVARCAVLTAPPTILGTHGRVQTFVRGPSA